MALNKSNILNKVNLRTNYLFSRGSSNVKRTIPNKLTDLLNVYASKKSTPNNTTDSTQITANSDKSNTTETKTTLSRETADQKSNLGVRSEIRKSLAIIGQIVKQSVNLNAFNAMNQNNINNALLDQQRNIVENNVQNAAKRNPSLNKQNSQKVAASNSNKTTNSYLNIDVPRITDDLQKRSFFESSINRASRYGAMKNTDFSNLTYRLNNAMQNTKMAGKSLNELYKNEPKPTLNISEKPETSTNKLPEFKPTSRNELAQFSFQGSFTLGGNMDIVF